MFGKLLTIAAVTFFSFLPYLLAHTITGNPGTAQVFLGSADGKSFFAETTPKRTWSAARNYCNETGMHLASVTSAVQRDLLVSAYNNVSFIGEYWTAGRDAQAMSQFVWDHDGQHPNGAILKLNDIVGIQTCLSYNTHGGAGDYHSTLCSEALGTLCEIVHERKN